LGHARLEHGVHVSDLGVRAFPVGNVAYDPSKSDRRSRGIGYRSYPHGRVVCGARTPLQTHLPLTRPLAARFAGDSIELRPKGGPVLLRHEHSDRLVGEVLLANPETLARREVGVCDQTLKIGHEVG